MACFEGFQALGTPSPTSRVSIRFSRVAMEARRGVATEMSGDARWRGVGDDWETGKLNDWFWQLPGTRPGGI